MEKLHMSDCSTNNEPALPNSNCDCSVAEKSDEFTNLVRPLMKWLAENKNPHAKIIVESTSAELLSAEQTHLTENYLAD